MCFLVLFVFLFSFSMAFSSVFFLTGPASLSVDEFDCFNIAYGVHPYACPYACFVTYSHLLVY